MMTNGETSGLPASVGELHAAGAQRSGIENIFMGPSGIRSGWRLLIFIFLMLACLKAEAFTLKHIPGVDAWLKAQDQNVFTPALAIVSEGIMLLALLVATGVMALIEKRTYADYYLPMNQFLGKRFWQGVPYGFAMLSLLLVLIAAFHGFSLAGMALPGADALKFGALYGIAFLMVGLFEEGCFRGYMQATLGPGIGFWPAAIILSILFGAIHLSNLGEAWFGAAVLRAPLL
jgi:membrane protease YdiL (CAAX protease family)